MHGRIVNIAFQKGSKVEVDLLPIMLKRLTLTGSTLRPRSVAEKAEIARALEDKVWPLFAEGKIKPVIYKTFPLAEAADAHALMESSSMWARSCLSRKTRCIRSGADLYSGNPNTQLAVIRNLRAVPKERKIDVQRTADAQGHRRLAG